jgi:hypothetical protein
MFSKQTVLITGAGAGFDIDMCLGSTLIKEIASDVDFYFQAGQLDRGSAAIDQALRRVATSTQDYNALFLAGRRIASGITTSGSIDNYIHNHRNNPAIKTVGKIAIVNTILKYERKSKVFIDETKHPQVFRDPIGLENSWFHIFFRLLGERIIVGETLEGIFDNLSVITFNYDRCFEQYLWKSLQQRFAINGEEATSLMAKLRIHHPYGKIAKLPWEDPHGVPLGGDPHGNEVQLDKFFKNIRTYNEEVEQGEKLAEARNWLQSATRAIFLGFHFHDPNVELIKSQSDSERTNVQQAFATVLDRSGPERNIINEQLNQILRGVPNLYLEQVQCNRLLSMYGTTFTR